MGENKDLVCPECGLPMKLCNSKYGKFYGCVGYPVCKGTHGARLDGTPLGVPGDAETKKWRMKAHSVFDSWWRSKKIERNKAYQTLQEVMAMSPDDAHIGRFNIDQCEKVIESFSIERGGE